MVISVVQTAAAAVGIVAAGIAAVAYLVNRIEVCRRNMVR